MSSPSNVAPTIHHVFTWAGRPTANQDVVTPAETMNATPTAGQSAPPFPWLSPWKRALVMVLMMLRNVDASTAIAWAIAFVTTRGNIFSSVTPTQQSHVTFFVSSLLLTHVSANLNNWGTGMSPWHFDRRVRPASQHRPTLLAFAARVAFDAAPHYALSTACTFGMGVLFSSTWFPHSLEAFRLDMFCMTIANHYGFVATDCVARIEVSRSIVAESRRSISIAAAIQSPPRIHSSQHSIPRSYIRTLPFVLPVLIAGLYVHATSQWVFSSTKRFESDAFIVASLALRILAQEIAKLYLQRRHVKLLHVMCAMISLPTILIDTQVRVVILSLNNTQSTLTRTYAMGALEIVLRLLKALHLRKTIAKKARIVEMSSNTTAFTNQPPPRDFGTCINFEQWRKQMIDLHTAETFADMYAEHIAFGSSAAIMYFFGNSNPHYRLGHATVGATMQTGLAGTLTIQILFEVAVDYFSCVMELYLGGIEQSDEVSRLGAFLGFLSMMFTVVNVDLSSVVYLKSP